MSRPKYYWYGIVKKMVCRYSILNTAIPNERKYKKAIDKVLNDIAELPEGERRIKAIRLVLLDHTHTTDGAALAVDYSWRTVQNWTRDFIYRVGKETGF